MCGSARIVLCSTRPDCPVARRAPINFRLRNQRWCPVQVNCHQLIPVRPSITKSQSIWTWATWRRTRTDSTVASAWWPSPPEWASPSGNVYTISAGSLKANLNHLIIQSNLIYFNLKKNCLAYVIFSDDAVVTCPYRDDNYACDAALQEREIKSIKYFIIS